MISWVLRRILYHVSRVCCRVFRSRLKYIRWIFSAARVLLYVWLCRSVNNIWIALSAILQLPKYVLCWAVAVARASPSGCYLSRKGVWMSYYCWPVRAWTVATDNHSGRRILIVMTLCTCAYRCWYGSIDIIIGDALWCSLAWLCSLGVMSHSRIAWQFLMG